MKLNKQQAFNKWAKQKKFSQEKKYNNVKSAEWYKYMKDLQRALKQFTDYNSFILEGVGNLSEFIVSRESFFEKENWIDIDEKQARIYAMFLGYGYINKFKEETGYKQIWDVKEVNWNDVSKYMYDVDDKNIIKHLENNRKLVWVKIT
jgi:hypothetical protein